MLLLLQVPILVIEATNKRFLFSNLLTVNSKVSQLQDLSYNDIQLIDLNKNQKINEKFQNSKILKNLFQKYWREYIYIFPSNKASEKFTNIDYKDSLQKDINNKHKIFYEEGSTNLKTQLVNRQVKASYLHSLNELDNESCIQYKYNKHLKKLFTQLQIFWQYKNTIMRRSNHLARILENQKFPVFIVTNGLQEIIVGQPEHRLQASSNSLISFAKELFPNKIPKNEYQLPLKESYIFVNPLDALEYCNYLQALYPYSSKELRLKIFVGTLSDFYRKNRTFSEEVQFRLLPDLKEVGKLVKKYQHKSNLNFHPHQLYGPHYFQGQPIYFINPIKCNYFDEQNKIITKRYFPNSLTLSDKEYTSVFTTYEQAMLIWKKYQKKFSNYILPIKPKLTVYNLESLLNEYSNKQITLNTVNKALRLIPANETYEYLQKNQEIENPHLLVKGNLSLPVAAQTKVFFKRVLWGMFKWYPPTY